MSKRKDRYNIHHRRPQSIGGDSRPANLSEVRIDHHKAWHTLFGNMTAQEIMSEINDKWLDYRYKMTVHKMQDP